MARHNEFGRQGEQIAAEYLLKKGYIIRERNWRLNKLEVDIVAERNDRIVIVEVKSRESDAIEPFKSIDRHKRMRLINAGRGYLNYMSVDKDLQFDVIFIIGTLDDYRIEHHEDVYMPPLRTY